jgi:1-acyl-sn-glycerol-3-phosphate acyltransferase
VAAFAAADPDLGSERLVLVAETRERDPARRAALERAVRERATDILGLPPDEIVLAPPRAVPKTSSGKLRRGATRDLWLAGKLMSGPTPPLWQLARVWASGLAAVIARAIRRVPDWLYAAYAWTLFAALAPWVWLGVMVLPQMPWRWALVRWGVRLLRRLALVPLEVTGRERIPPPGRAFVLASNHQSYLDAMVLVEAIGRPIAFVAKQELAANPLVKAALVRLGTHFVERFDLLRGAGDATRLAAALGQGEILGFFPEGTFRDQPGLLPFRMGAFLAAAGGGVPLLPVAVLGTRELMRGNSFFPRPGRAAVVIGEPLQPTGNDWEAAVGLRDQTRAFVATYCGEPDAGA